MLLVGWTAVPVEAKPPIGGSAVERLSGASGEGVGDVGRKARPTGQVIVFGTGKRAPHLYLRAQMAERYSGWEYDRWFVPGEIGFEPVSPRQSKVGKVGGLEVEGLKVGGLEVGGLEVGGLGVGGLGVGGLGVGGLEVGGLGVGGLGVGGLGVGGLGVGGLEVGGLEVEGLEVEGLKVEGLEVGGLEVGGLEVEGLGVGGLGVGGLEVGGQVDGRTDFKPTTTERSFLTRALGGVDAEWGKFNGLGPRLNFSHNLNRVFPAELFDSQPELFPMVGGQRMRPGTGRVNWNPDLGEPRVAGVAAEAAMQYFRANPDTVSFALGVNDGLRFGESPATLKWVEPAKWFRDRPDYSDLIFNFMNAVAEKTVVEWPEKYVGALAYYWAENVPSFPLHPNVIPFLTADRSQFYDREFREEELGLQEKWGRARAANRKAVSGDGGDAELTESLSESGKLEGRKVQAGMSGIKPDPHSEAVTRVNGKLGMGNGAAAGSSSEGVKVEDRKVQAGMSGIKPDPHSEAVTRVNGKLGMGNGAAAGSPVSGEATATESRVSGEANSSKLPAPSSQPRVGIYDYIYGTGFLIPRIHTQALAEHLKHARRAGFTDYFAEMSPNWGLDGPQPWLVSQLLMDPELSVDALLREYYTRYFRTAARPMRQFFERCEAVWNQQPGRPYWLKHFRNDSQAALFPAKEIARLRGYLERAVALAGDDLVLADRVRLVSDAFGVTERFSRFYTARDLLARTVMETEGQVDFNAKALRRGERENIDENNIEELATKRRENTLKGGAAKPLVNGKKRMENGGATSSAVGGGADVGHKALPTGENLGGLLENYQAARDELVRYVGWLQTAQPLALSKWNIEDFLRYDPGETARALLGARSQAQAHGAFDDQWSELRPLYSKRWEGDSFPAQIIAGLPYSIGLPLGWQSTVEPWQGLVAELRRGKDDGEARAPILRLENNKLTTLWQWTRVPVGAKESPVNGKLGMGNGGNDQFANLSIEVRGRVGVSAFLSLTATWLDADQKQIGSSVDVKLPAGDWPAWVKLRNIAAPPANAAYLNFMVWVAHQQPGDWLEVRDPRLEWFFFKN